MYKYILLIGAGSFIGGVSRFLMSRYIQNSVVSGFPYGTLLVNVLGCLLIGLFYGLSERGNFMSPELRMFLTVGICGGFTTFSTFSMESFSLLKDGNFFQFTLYTTLSLFLCLAATWAGNAATKLL